nr:uncharacterized protein LOC109166976 [Ipomoea batatas]
MPTVFANAEFIEQIGNYVGVFKIVDPHNFGMRAGARKPVKFVGAKWLLAELPAVAVCVPSTPTIPTHHPAQVEESNPM